MKPFYKCIDEYKKQVKKGDIKEAYQGLMSYIMQLKTYLNNKYPDYIVSGSIYLGYMDMTYFSFFPQSLQKRKLKVAIVFLHEAFRFEVWLAGYNKNIQTYYWKLLQASAWKKYRIPSSLEGRDSILEHIVVENPDFSKLDALTQRIEKGTLSFIRDVEAFLSKK
jgi:hypothetical protein